jgi:prepilin-type N-terminal cleavage/methylation domain-containing protein
MKVRFNRQTGFTLVELLVAVGITAFLASLMVSVVAQAAALWSRSAGRLGCESRARFALEQIADDLAGLHFRDGGDTWLAAGIAAEVGGVSAVGRSKPVGDISLALGGGRLDEARFGGGGAWLRCVTTRRGRNTSLETISAPVLVDYRIQRRPGASGTGFHVLARTELSPEQLMRRETLMTETDGEGEIQTASVEGVVDFGIRCLFRDNGLGSADFVFPPIPRPDREGATRIPAVVDVMVRILTDEGARLLARFEDGGSPLPPSANAAEAWWEIVLQHSHVYTRRVVLRTQ